MSLLKRCASFFRSRKLDQDLEDELRSHMEMRAEDNAEAGMPQVEALLDATRRFGNRALIAEQTRTQDTLNWLETIWQDLRYAGRVMSKNRAFSAMAILIVAVGIGASTTLFSITDTSLRHSISPVDDRWIMLRAFYPQKNLRVFTFSAQEFFEIRSLDQIFEKTAFIGGSGCTLVVDNVPARTECTRITADAIPLTHVSPLFGRVFSPEEDRHDGPKVAILSYEQWQEQFQGDRRALGDTVKIQDESYTIIGIMPPKYDLWGGRVWMPYQLRTADNNPEDRRARIIGLLRPGVTERQANARLQELAVRMERDYAGIRPEYKGMTLSVWNVHEAVVGGVKPALIILLAAVGLLVLVACANLGSLLLARATTRRREMAIRAALGARRLRIVRQLMVESLVLSFFGGVLGMLFAVWGVPAAVSLVPQLPFSYEARLTPGALVAALAVTFLMGVLFGIAPAFSSARTKLMEAFKEGSGAAGVGRSRHLVRNTLVVAEIALSLVILASAVLMIRTYRQLTQLDIGYNTQNLLTMEVGLPDVRYPHPADLTRFFRDLTLRLASSPGIQGAAIVSGHPLMDRVVDSSTQNFELEGQQSVKDAANANFRVITPDYFRVTGTRLLNGRYFEQQDDADHPYVVIINKTMAHLYWPKEDALGKRVRLGALSGQALALPVNSSPWATVVGIVDDAKQIDVIDAPVRQEMFFPLQQRGGLRTMTLMLRSELDQASLTDAARHAIQAMDPELPIDQVFSMQQLVSFSFGAKRLTTVLLVFFAIACVTLVIAGLYAVMAFSVTQRTREIGVRMALGAQRRDVLVTILRQGLSLGAMGLALGLVASLGATRVLRSLFVSIDPVDALTLSLACAGLALIVLLASYVPSLRATKVDPMVALRHE